MRDRLITEFNLDIMTVEQIDAYIQLLLKWNQAKNLIGKSTEQDIWKRHILDSVQLVPLIPEHTQTLSDFGAGAGIPGVILALCFPDITVHLIDSNGKKSRFMQEAARHCHIPNMQVHQCRAETLTPWKSDVITARAFAPLPRLFTYIFPFFAKESLCILPKGCNYDKEIYEAQQTWSFDYSVTASLVQEQSSDENNIADRNGVILRVKELTRR